MVAIYDVSGGVEVLKAVVHPVGVDKCLGGQDVSLGTCKRVYILREGCHGFQAGGDQERVQVEESEVQLCLLIQIAPEHVGEVDEVRVGAGVDEVTLHYGFTLRSCQHITHAAAVTHEKCAPTGHQ